MFEKNFGVRVNAVKNQSVGALMIYNLQETDVRVDTDLYFSEMNKTLEQGHT